MRISDWSSDVCSSDLVPAWSGGAAPRAFCSWRSSCHRRRVPAKRSSIADKLLAWYDVQARALPWRAPPGTPARSEEHTSELQSLMRISYAVFCLKKKKAQITSYYIQNQ